MSLKTIQMDPTHLKITKQKRTKKTIVPPSLMINQPNLRQILLDKLMKHRKTQKKKDPDILSNNFDEQCNFPDRKEPEPHHFELPSVPVSIIPNDKPYGVLKNGLKPTYKTWNKSQKNSLEPVNMEPFCPDKKEEPVCHVNVLEEPPKVSTEVILSRETKIPIKIGKNKKNKTIHILIPCTNTRKNRVEERDTIRKTSLTTVKNYLKSHKLIKVGSTAPTNLIRQMYENAKCYGDVVNENKENLLYNYEKDSEESI